jgi:hypothetical protein
VQQPKAEQTGSSEQVPKAAERRGSHVWIERPWQMRYFMMVTDTWAIEKEGAIKRSGKPGRVSLEWKEIFEPTAAIPLPGALSEMRDTLSVALIEFNGQGMVTTPHSRGGQLRGRLNRLLYITLSTGEGPRDPQYDLGHWFMGLGDVSTDWAPGLCGQRDHPNPFSKTNAFYLYGPKFEINEYSATFGCREWAYQLYNDARPYVDVTSYIPKSVDKDGPGTYIREFIGWARFDDRKPVIGKHEKQWYCLHDCPGGDKPGPIADIRAWATTNKWPVPTPPTKMPMFPDPPAKAGTYRD